MARKSKKNKKLIIYLLVGAFFLLLLPLLINRPTIIRIVMTLASTALITFAILVNNRKYNKYANYIYICLLFLIMCLDSFIALSFKRIPIFSYNIIHSKDVRVYNAFGIRVWQCDQTNYKDLEVELFSKDGYVCSGQNIEAIDSNDFFIELEENYENYYNKIFKIKGYINNKQGQSYVELQPYELDEEGNVIFDDKYTLKVILAESDLNLNYYNVYDSISVIGRIKNIEDYEEKKIIYMYEAEIDYEIDEETIE